MSTKVFLLAASLALGAPLFAQGLPSFLPAKAAARATRIIASIAESSAAIEARRVAARKAQLSAESEMLEAYALVVASRTSGASWAREDGSSRSENAGLAFGAARERAVAASRSLADASMGGELEALLASRDKNLEALSELVVAAALGEKSSLALEKNLSLAAKELGRLFPEAMEIEALLRKAGAQGARLASLAMIRREPEGAARVLLSQKARILALSPAAAGALARLEAALAAYESWSANFPPAAFPGGLASLTGEERLALSSGIEAISSLGGDRASALLGAMSGLGSRDAAAAEASLRLATAWSRSPAARRRELAGLCGLRESRMAVFASQAEAAFPDSAAPFRQGRVAAKDPIATLAAINGLSIAIADEETLASPGQANAGPPTKARGPEPALLFLERPELALAAVAEPRFAGLYAEASRRILSLYAQAAEGAQARLEAQPQLSRAASLALGSKAESLIVSSADLPRAEGDFGRRIAFLATATDSAGFSVNLPLRADIAGPEYAAAFAKAARLGAEKFDSSALLAKYGQAVVSAYDPEGSREDLAVGLFPRSSGPASRLLSNTDAELALIGGWRP
jgi:hypothetical protein